MHPRSTAAALLLLTLLCVWLYGAGLTSHGLTNWQEAQRALVARDMQRHDAWLVPTVHGRPYLAKPPMFYWLQIALANALGREVDETVLRLSVALAGWTGVLGTYLLTRRLLCSDPAALQTDPGVAPHDMPARAAWWSALFLATGLLYVRSSRTGELDILLVPFTLAAVWCAWEAWRSSVRASARTSGASPAGDVHTVRLPWGWIAGASLACAGAALTKGPPALVPIACATAGGMSLWHATAPGGARLPARRLRTLAPSGAALAAAVALLLARPSDLREWGGLILLTIMGGALATALVGLTCPDRMQALRVSLRRTQPMVFLAAGAVAYAVWLWAASRAKADVPLAAALEAEALDNLRPLVLRSPVINLEATAYGAGLGSLGAMAATVWLARRRSLPPAWAVLLAWSGGSLIAFSTLGKGVPRYLTPMWPALAMMGGVWFTHIVHSRPQGRSACAFATASVLVLAGGLGWWYGWGRERFASWRSPRALVGELRAAGISPHRLATLDFTSPALDFYAGMPVTAYGEQAGQRGQPLTALLEDLATGERIVLIPQPDPSQASAALERLVAHGLHVEPLPLKARFVMGHGRTAVAVVRVRRHDRTP